MSTKPKVNITLATQEELPELIQFLSLPEIDNSFVAPLSQREITIEQRVFRNFQFGFWLIARVEGQIVGCRAVKYDPKTNIAELTTLVVHPNFRGLGIAYKLVEEGIKKAIELHHPVCIRFDSWTTNIQAAKLSAKFGFKKVAEYEDPGKRPEGVKTVLYELSVDQFLEDQRKKRDQKFDDT